MSAPQVTLLDQLLSQIITETHTGSQEMVRLNAQVSGAAAGIRSDQISDSGKVINSRLEFWETNWIQVKSALDELNSRVTNMRQSLLTGLDNALASAQSGA